MSPCGLCYPPLEGLHAWDYTRETWEGGKTEDWLENPSPTAAGGENFPAWTWECPVQDWWDRKDPLPALPYSLPEKPKAFGSCVFSSWDTPLCILSEEQGVKNPTAPTAPMGSWPHTQKGKPTGRKLPGMLIPGMQLSTSPKNQDWELRHLLQLKVCLSNRSCLNNAKNSGGVDKDNEVLLLGSL